MKWMHFCSHAHILGKIVFLLLYLLLSEEKTGIVNRKSSRNRQYTMNGEKSMWARVKTQAVFLYLLYEAIITTFGDLWFFLKFLIIFSCEILVSYLKVHLYCWAFRTGLYRSTIKYKCKILSAEGRRNRFYYYLQIVVYVPMYK